MGVRFQFRWMLLVFGEEAVLNWSLTPICLCPWSLTPIWLTRICPIQGPTPLRSGFLRGVGTQAHAGVVVAQGLAGVGRQVLAHIVGRAYGHHLAARFAAFGAEVEQPVAGADHVQVVFNHQQRMAGVKQLTQGAHKFGDVVEMQTRGGLIEHKQRAAFGHRLAAAGGAFGGLGQKPCQLEALCFAARQGRHRLAELYVLQPHVHDGLQGPDDFAVGGKNGGSLADREVQHISHIEADQTRGHGLAAFDQHRVGNQMLCRLLFGWRGTATPPRLRLACRWHVEGSQLLADSDNRPFDPSTGSGQAKRRANGFRRGTRHQQRRYRNPALDTHLQDFGPVALAVAIRATQVDVAQELHFHVFKPGATTGGAAPIAAIEAEFGSAVAALPRQMRVGKNLADGVPGAHITDRVGTCRLAYRRLVHEHHVGQLVGAQQALERTRRVGGAAKMAHQRRRQHILDQGGLARAADAGHANQALQRYLDRHVLQVVFAYAFEHQARRVVRHQALEAHAHLLAPAQVGASQGVGLAQVLRAAVEHDLPAAFARPRPHVQHAIGRQHHGRVVLHHHQRIARIAQAQHGLDDAVHVTRMQADAGLVQHKQRIDE